MTSPHESYTEQYLETLRVRCVSRKSSAKAWQVRIVSKGKMIVDERFADLYRGGPIRSLMAAIARRDEWYSILGRDKDKPPRPWRKSEVWNVPKAGILRKEKYKEQEMKREESPEIGVRRAVRDGEQGFEAYRGKESRFFSIEEWGEDGARQFAETQLRIWKNRAANKQ